MLQNREITNFKTGKKEGSKPGNSRLKTGTNDASKPGNNRLQNRGKRGFKAGKILGLNPSLFDFFDFFDFFF